VNRFREVESRWGYSGTSDRVRFVVDRRIFVVGFGIYGSIMHGKQEYEVTISLMRTGATKSLASLETTLVSDGATTPYRILFKEPVEVMPNVSYTACAALKVRSSSLLFLSIIWASQPSCIHTDYGHNDDQFSSKSCGESWIPYMNLYFLF
jgi:hypothetical protein